jgi:hypothetical protein
MGGRKLSRQILTELQIRQRAEFAVLSLGIC